MIKGVYQLETISGAALSPGELRDLLRARARALPGYHLEPYFSGKPEQSAATRHAAKNIDREHAPHGTAVDVDVIVADLAIRDLDWLAALSPSTWRRSPL